ncbi:hypothetical protein SAMN04487770_10766 [Butyrivibrio sp. ob235]|uniref:hypothetical protein n=1 Tax=Butyrivibrio sp. ob235 TaxID=1761780 RepID=UPI0008CE9A4D|nr:hypothetical protein [Butyrivibrio sp. ob235]SEL21067.1 hypothetical protein SAMN04487770_10766 [Butyrivibrio sp. ob235]
MKTRNKLTATICIICILIISSLTKVCEANASENVTPGTPIRFGYVESEEYGSFTQLLLDIALEFTAEGSVDESFAGKYKDVNFEEKLSSGDTLKLWNDICDAGVAGAKYVFVRDAFFNLDDMNEEDYKSVTNRDDVDIILSMGTASGVYLKNNEKKNKFINMYAADPIESGIVKSETERFDDRSFALMDTTPYIRQLDAGYKFIGFKKLGVVYEDSRDAYIYSGIPTIEAKAKEYGFEVVYENVDEPVTDDDYERYYEELKQAYRKLADKGIDCLLVTISSIEYEEKMQELLDDCIIPKKIKTMAQDELMPVVNGVLFGITMTDCSESANHVVQQIRRYAEEGVPFDQLDMVCETTPKIGVNYTTAQKVDFDISFSNLQLVDYIYRDDKK